MISGSWYVIRDIPNFKELYSKNRLLEENLANMELELLKLKEDKIENQRLRELLDFTERNKHKFIPSIVIARDSLASYSTIIIDKGKKDGVKKDMPVISGAGLVGRVYESGWSISRVILITSNDLAVGSIVQRTRDIGVVTGDPNLGLIMKYLELDCEVKSGDKVITSGFSGIYEKGMLIGEVVRLEEDDSGLYIKAIIKPETDMMKLEEVLVIK
ncbi:MAG: rod shape-determining protein MreC [Candidatus Omnitrophota bacterium]